MILDGSTVFPGPYIISSYHAEARVVTGWLADFVIGLYSEREDCKHEEFKEMAKCLQHVGFRFCSRNESIA